MSVKLDNKGLKIIQFARNFGVNTGIGMVSYQLAKNINKQGADITTVAVNCNYDKGEPLGNVLEIRVLHFIEKVFGARLGVFISVVLFDIISFLLSIYYRFRGYRVIGHTCLALSNIQIGHSCHLFAVKTKIKNRNYKWLINPIHYYLLLRDWFLYKFFTKKVVAISNAIKEEYFSAYRFPNEKIHVVPNGVDVGFFNKEKLKGEILSFKASIGLVSSDTKILTFIGNELERKGFNTIIKCLGLLKDEDVKLAIVGASNKDTVIQLCNEFGILSKCTFLGPRSDINTIMCASDFVFLMSDYEPFGLVGIECMASGAVLITTGVDGISDYAKDNYNCIMVQSDYIELANSIRQNINSDLSTVRRNGYITASNYSWEKIVEMYLSIIQKQ